MNIIIQANQPMDNSTISSGMLLINQATLTGDPKLQNGILYLCVNPGDGVWKMVPQSQWESMGLNLDQPNLYLWITFGAAPTSNAWGNYYVLGEILWYMKNLGLTLQQVTGL